MCLFQFECGVQYKARLDIGLDSLLTFQKSSRDHVMIFMRGVYFAALSQYFSTAGMDH